MFIHTTQLRVRYGETDRMGFVYYGFYAQYYEVGRVETMRKLGFPYKKLEDSGILLPVLDLEIKYIKPAFYDDMLTVKTSIAEMPATRIKFLYEIFNQEKQLINQGKTTLVFVDQSKHKPVMAPVLVLKALDKYFTS